MSICLQVMGQEMNQFLVSFEISRLKLQIMEIAKIESIKRDN